MANPKSVNGRRNTHGQKAHVQEQAAKEVSDRAWKAQMEKQEQEVLAQRPAQPSDHYWKNGVEYLYGMPIQKSVQK